MSHDVDPSVQQALARVRELTEGGLPSLGVERRGLDPAELQRFSDELPRELDEATHERLRRRAEELSPWVQGPFYLGGEVVIAGSGRDDQRWDAIADLVPDVRGKRVLDIGSGAGYDPFMLHVRGAAEILACEPSDSIQQARFLESVYRTGIRFERVGWQQLDPALHGRFDVIHCNGVLHREPDPMGMLVRLRALLSDEGELLLGSVMLADAELAEYARFVPTDYAGDPTWWWVPGRLTLRRMMDACGLEAAPLPARFLGPFGDFEVTGGYMRATAKPLATHLAVASEAPAPARAEPGGPANRFPIGHYYSPMYDTREIAAARDRIWSATPRETPGIDWRDEAQLSLCRDVFAEQAKLEFVDDPVDDPSVYHAGNDQYPPLDAWVLAGLLEHLRPARMIEVGAGFSTLVSARVNRERLDGQLRLTCIEPHPREFLTAGVRGVSEVRVEKVQDTPFELFAELGDRDVLFIDTAHTVKTGGDVVWIFQEIIPRLAPGVYVHIHDVFAPGEYPEEWVMQGWGWNESYLVRAFLQFNLAFEIVWGQQHMLFHHLDELHRAFPALSRYHASGAALWVRRVG